MNSKATLLSNALNINNNLTDNNNTSNSAKSNNSNDESLVSCSPTLLKEILQKENKHKKDQLEDVEMIDDERLVNQGISGLSNLQFQLKPETSIKRHITLKVVPVSTSNTNIINNDSSKLNSANIIKNSNPNTTILLNGASKYEAALSLSSLNESSLTAKNPIKLVANSSTNTPLLNEISNHLATPLSTPIVTTTTVSLSESSDPNACYLAHHTTPLDIITSSSKSLQQQSLTSPLLSISKNEDKKSSSTSTLPSLVNLTPSNHGINCMSSSSSSSSISSSQPVKIVRDEKRRANHNEVEKRRRNNINKWIVELSKVIPDCSNDQSKHGQSKGGILEKTVQYLIDMKVANQRLSEHIHSLEGLRQENEFLKEQNERFKKENDYLKEKVGQETEMSGSSNSNNVIRLPSIHTLANNAIDVNNNNSNNDKNSSQKIVELNLIENDTNSNFSSSSNVMPSKIDQILMIAYNKI